MSRLAVTFGRLLPRWQVKQVTTWRPLKYCLLMPCIMVTIWRAMVLRGLTSFA